VLKYPRGGTMPRRARKLSLTGIYHVMLRGINQQKIMEDKEDKEKLLTILKECKLISGYKLYAYCLMGNHLHLIIKVEEEPLDKIFKRICGRYVYWYNAKYRRVGHLFQDRFKSEPIEDERYLLSVLRYIHYRS
jgi:putative transposase